MEQLRLAVIGDGESVFSYSNDSMVLVSSDSIRFLFFEFDDGGCPRIDEERSITFDNEIINPATKKGIFVGMGHVREASLGSITIEYDNGELLVAKFAFGDEERPTLTSVAAIIHGDNEITVVSDDYSVSTF